MPLYILKELDSQGRVFQDDDTTEYFDDTDHNGNALDAAMDAYNFRVGQTDEAWGAGVGATRWTLLQVG
ncbi:hypothetical protein HUT19_41920 (plasmid) [Streptomyces sp. NA02950]|uniref:hypothetical protein n=1 Tax=Streptomyces sp. NA02950 TaxID=2742137 RepID=UPI00159074EE|nr:hypothetical protein [Streptomyces sp. NA02950]QKV98278.1 hypothetical protein HUT19_41920 [Streptomyces sp. NA02950]